MTIATGQFERKTIELVVGIAYDRFRVSVELEGLRCLEYGCQPVHNHLRHREESSTAMFT